MPAGLGFMVRAILGTNYNGVSEFTAFGGTVCTAECRVSCFNGCVFCEVQLCLVVVSIVVLSQAIFCPVVRIIF